MNEGIGTRSDSDSIGSAHKWRHKYLFGTIIDPYIYGIYRIYSTVIIDTERQGQVVPCRDDAWEP
jgi:hypothetical protein